MSLVQLWTRWPRVFGAALINTGGQKIWIPGSLVISVLFYSYETWTLPKTFRSNLNAFGLVLGSWVTISQISSSTNSSTCTLFLVCFRSTSSAVRPMLLNHFELNPAYCVLFTEDTSWVDYLCCSTHASCLQQMRKNLLEMGGG